MIGRSAKKAVTALLRLMFYNNGVFVPRWGELRGLSFRILDNESVPLAFLAGAWERDHFRMIQHLREAGAIPQSKAIVCDIGAHIGFYTAWFDRFYKQDCVIYAFEPSPLVSGRLSDTVALNRCAGVRIVPKAVADKEGSTTFYLSDHNSTGSIHPAGSEPRAVTVETIDLDGFFYGPERREPPHFMKIDIEGGCTHAFPGARRLFREAAPLVIMDSHNVKEDAAVGAMLSELGWSAFRLDNGEWVTNMEATAPVRNGVWGTMVLCSAEKKPLVQDAVNRMFHRVRAS